jgi:large subunit ribosomal protein L20
VPRVKRSVAARKRHKKVLQATKGQRGTKHALFRRANEALLTSLKYATRDRRDRKHDMRRLWITRINAAARLNGMSYSRFIQGLRLAGIDVNRKMLADMAITDPTAFTQIATAAREAVQAEA